MKRKAVHKKRNTKKGKQFRKFFIIFSSLFVSITLVFFFLHKNNDSVLGIATPDNRTTFLVAGQLIKIPRNLQQKNGAPGTSTHLTGAIPSTKVISPHVSRLSLLQKTQKTLASIFSAYASIVAGGPEGGDVMGLYNSPIADQGNLSSCTTWAIGYYLRGWYAKRDGYYPSGGFAPMYLYSQLYKRYKCTDPATCGLYPEDVAVLLTSQGIDTQHDYVQGNYSISPPTSKEQTNAQQYGFTTSAQAYDVIFGGHNNDSLTDPKIGQDKESMNIQTVIEQTLDNGQPLQISIPVFRSFDNASYSNPLIKLPTHDDIQAYQLKYNSPLRGYHALFAFDYDKNGLWFLNSWGTNWGHNGGAELSWDYIRQYANEGIVIRSPRRPFVKTCNYPNSCGKTCAYGTHVVTKVCDVNNRLMCCAPNPPTPTPTPKICVKADCVRSTHQCTIAGGKVDTSYACSTGYCCKF